MPSITLDDIAAFVPCRHFHKRYSVGYLRVGSCRRCSTSCDCVEAYDCPQCPQYNRTGPIEDPETPEERRRHVREDTERLLLNRPGRPRCTAPPVELPPLPPRQYNRRAPDLSNKARVALWRAENRARYLAQRKNRRRARALQSESL